MCHANRFKMIAQTSKAGQNVANLLNSLVPVLGDGVCEAFIDVLQQGRQLLSLGLRHVFQQ